MVKDINSCIGVTTLCSEKMENTTTMQELERLKKQLAELERDLEWRIPDVQGEDAKLEELIARADGDPYVDVATQATIVRVLKDVLQDKINEAETLKKRIKELEDQLGLLGAAAPKKKRKAKHVETIR
jgi:hypothetical protein